MSTESDISAPAPPGAVLWPVSHGKNMGPDQVAVLPLPSGHAQFSPANLARVFLFFVVFRLVVPATADFSRRARSADADSYSRPSDRASSASVGTSSPEKAFKRIA